MIILKKTGACHRHSQLMYIACLCRSCCCKPYQKIDIRQMTSVHHHRSCRMNERKQRQIIERKNGECEINQIKHASNLLKFCLIFLLLFVMQSSIRERAPIAPHSSYANFCSTPLPTPSSVYWLGDISSTSIYIGAVVLCECVIKTAVECLYVLYCYTIL